MIARLQSNNTVNKRDKHRIDMKKKAVIVSGYFNPIHKGHLEYFNNAKAIADELFVIVNTDHQRALKCSQEFQSEEERMIIVSNIKAVDKAILSVDENRTVCATLEKIAREYGSSYHLAFANGGDQNNNTIPERPICKKLGIALIDGLGNKIQSSSWLLKNF
jgi:D-beta-D-heptose 7-phosphate kinase/D-beta-D-heptose 1-phosphate adenosyltransferase